MRQYLTEVCDLEMVSIYSDPDQELLRQSSQTVYQCTYLGQKSLQVVEINSFVSVVGMVPCFEVTPDGSINVLEDLYFLVEQPSLEVARFFGLGEDEDEGEEDDLSNG